MMSGALPVEVSRWAWELDSFISGTELLELTKWPSRIRKPSFDHNFVAANILRPTGFDAPSELFSRPGIHERSRCASPTFAPYDFGNRVPGRRMQDFALDDVRPRSSAGLTDLSNTFMGTTHIRSTGIATCLPTEILQAVYDYLGPLDFNAARHTCRSWIIASLNVDILFDQLKRGGCWTKASCKLSLLQEWRPWPMSCYFARECALAGNWTGQELFFLWRARKQSCGGKL
jgi:hypothetical protein